MRPAPPVFFSNAVFTLVRSGVQRPPGHFVFRVPRFFTALDIRQYIQGLYPALRVAAVTTTNFLSHTTRAGRRRVPAKKNAVVSLLDAGSGAPCAFSFPPQLSDEQMEAWARVHGALPDANVYPSAHPITPVDIPSDRSHVLI